MWRLPAARGGREQGTSGTVNPGEVPITTVRFDKPERMHKRLTGLDQKVCDQVAGGSAFPTRRRRVTGPEARPNPLSYVRGTW